VVGFSFLFDVIVRASLGAGGLTIKCDKLGEDLEGFLGDGLVVNSDQILSKHSSQNHKDDE
jgi:hypothetical protein